MAIYNSSMVVHATYSAGETFWNVTECRNEKDRVFIVQKHTNYDIPRIEAEFKTKQSAIDYCKEVYRSLYDIEKERSKWVYKWAKGR